MKPKRYTIDELGEISGFSRRTIRYYIQEGLVAPPAGRGRGGFYFDSHLDALRRIRMLQAGGLGLAAIRRMLDSSERVPAAAEDRPRLPDAPPAERQVWVKYSICPGIEIHVERALEEGQARKVEEVVRVARAILSQGRKH